MSDYTLEELREFCDERGIKYDKRNKEKSLIKLLDEYEKNNNSVKEDESEQIKKTESKEDVNKFEDVDKRLDAISKEEITEAFKNSVVYGLLGSDYINIYNTRGDGFIREYSFASHGENWLELAKQFIKGRQMKQK